MADNTVVNQQTMLVVIDAVGEGARDIVGPKPKGEMTAQQFVEPAAVMGDECSHSVTMRAWKLSTVLKIQERRRHCPFCQIGDEQSDPIVHEKIPQIWHF